jgi:hypothetical protein
VSCGPGRLGSGRVSGCGSAQRGATVSKLLTASERPFASIRGWDPPAWCNPGFRLGGFSTGRNPLTPASGKGALSIDRPQRIQSSRERSTPMAAADSGCNVSETSTQAQTLPAWVRLATKVSASEVRPEHSGPTISLRAPIGNPPCSSSSISRIPVGATV